MAFLCLFWDLVEREHCTSTSQQTCEIPNVPQSPLFYSMVYSDSALCSLTGVGRYSPPDAAVLLSNADEPPTVAVLLMYTYIAPAHTVTYGKSAFAACGSRWFPSHYIQGFHEISIPSQKYLSSLGSDKITWAPSVGHPFL